MNSLNEIAVKNYLKNKKHIIRESEPGEYTDEELHETAVEWTLEDMAYEVKELLEEYSDHIAI